MSTVLAAPPLPLSRRLARPAKGTLGLVLFLALWQASVPLVGLEAYFYPAPADVWRAFLDLVAKGILPVYLIDSIGRYASGVAIGTDCGEAYAKAFETDPTSAFGGIIAFNRPLDGAAAEQVARQFVEVLIAPGFDEAARHVFAGKQNVRLLEIPIARSSNHVDLKRVGGGLLVQTPDEWNLELEGLRVVTRRAPTDTQLRDLLFAWRVAKYVKSNAIVFCGDGRTLGVGAGQMSRIDSARIASIKAAHAGLSLAGSVVASDAFFPFRDGLDVVVDAGAVAVIQPGGSVRDEEVVAAADERGVAMVFSGVRHFRH